MRRYRPGVVWSRRPAFECRSRRSVRGRALFPGNALRRFRGVGGRRCVVLFVGVVCPCACNFCGAATWCAASMRRAGEFFCWRCCTPCLCWETSVSFVGKIARVGVVFCVPTARPLLLCALAPTSWGSNNIGVLAPGLVVRAIICVCRQCFSLRAWPCMSPNRVLRCILLCG